MVAGPDRFYKINMFLDDTSKDLWKELKYLSDRFDEVVLVAILNNKNEIIHREIVAMGTVAQCATSAIQIFRPVFTVHGAARIVLAHNHPSGDPAPSDSDITLTNKAAEVGKLLGCPLLDHIIVCKTAYTSFLDMGLIPSL